MKYLHGKFLVCLTALAAIALLPSARAEAELLPDEQATAFEYAVQASGGRLTGQDDVTSYVNDVAGRLVSGAAHWDSVEVAVLNRPDIVSWSLPFGRIGVSAGLVLALASEAELAAVLAHEIAHHSQAVLGSAPAPRQLQKPALVFAPGSDSSNFVLADANSYLEYLAPASVAVRESVADLTAQGLMADAGYDPVALVAFLERLDTLQPSHPLVTAHAPDPARVDQAKGNTARIEARRNRTEWFIGEREYEAVLDKLSGYRTASDLYHTAWQLSAQEADAAISTLGRAIEAYPNDTASYALRGELHLATGNPAAATSDLTKAVTLDADNAMYQLGLGRALAASGEPAKARTALLRSNELLPNTRAVLALGKLEESAGNRDQAKVYYFSIMRSGSSLAMEGQREFVRLDMQDRPFIYFMAQSLVRDGEFTTIITNQSGYDVEGMVVQFDATINGEDRVEVQSVGPLAANNQVRLYPGWQIGEDDTLENVYVRAISLK